MTFEGWVTDLAAALDLPDEIDTDTQLDLAREVAHGVDRRAAPVTAFMVGLAAGRAGGGAEEVDRAIGVARGLVAS